jgi:hypothetical protein
MQTTTDRGPWMPAEIAEHPGLSARHRALLCAIELLGGNEHGCWAGDYHLSRRVGTSPERVAQLIGQLERDGFLRIENDGWLPGIYGGRTRILTLVGYPERPEGER